MNSRFNERGGDGNAYSNSKNRVDGRERSANNRTPIRSGAKDTREFVRELEEEEKRKRLDLDKIYRQAGLYRRK